MLVCLGRRIFAPLLAVAAIVALTCSVQAAGLEAPHIAANGVGCLSCHQMTSTYPKLLPPLHHTPTDIDDTLANNVCWSCHNDPMPPACSACHPSTNAPLVLTHSSLTTGDSDHGPWTVECWVCHNPHRQEQNTYNGSTYGQYIRRAINLANISGLAKSGTKSVIFKGQTGPNSFADGDTTYNGICEVCHDQTDHYQGDGTSTDQNHAYVARLAQKNPNLTTQQNCVFCHNHQDGFRPSCPDCHGFPPAVGTGGPSGLVGPGNVRSNGSYDAPAPTGSTSHGKHTLHATSAGSNYPCHTCHFGGMSMTMTSSQQDTDPDTPDHPDVDNKIQIGFNIEADDLLNYPAKKVLDNSGVIYHGQAGLQNGYTYTGTGTTIVDSAGTLTCNGVYCHTDGKSLLNVTDEYALSKYPPRFLDSKGNMTPAWNSDFVSFDAYNDGNRCNNCHDSPPRWDFHKAHLTFSVLFLQCSSCHWGTTTDIDDSDGVTITNKEKHVNGAYDVESGGYIRTGSDAWKARLSTAGATLHHTEGAFYYYINEFDYSPMTSHISGEFQGGQCSNILCHAGAGIDTTKRWTNHLIPTAITPSVPTYTVNNTQCGTAGTSSPTVQFSVSINNVTQCNNDCKAPFDLMFNDWGDGQSSDPPAGSYSNPHSYSMTYNPVCDPDHALFDVNNPVCPVNPDYNGADPACNPVDPTYDRYKRSCYPILIDHPDRAYEIFWSMWDSEGIPMDPQPQSKRVIVCPQVNVPVEFSGPFTAVAPGGRVLKITVNARDVDYNKGTHTGPGKIKISWGGVAADGSGQNTTIADLPLTNIYTTSPEFTFQYDRSAFFWVAVYIMDNDPRNTDANWTLVQLRSVRVD